MKKVGMFVNVKCLLADKVPVQEKVGDWAAYELGLGPNPAANLQLRKWLKKPGPPFGGMAFLDPKEALGEADVEALLPSHLTVDSVCSTKIKEFMKCAENTLSMYFWVLHPTFDTRNRMVASEILVRARNGSDSAPYEDVIAIMDPTAAADVREVYLAWKA